MVDAGAGVLLSVFFELLLEVVDEDGETACSVSGRSNNGGGLVAGWPKLAGEKPRVVALSNSKVGDTWQ
jgi:sulfopyruvate decarboxylase TPP-binding subunit